MNNETGRRKKVKNSSARKKPEKTEYEKIPMNSGKNNRNTRRTTPQRQGNYKVINGRKRHKFVNKLCILVLISLLCIILSFLSAVSPTGISEYFTNSFAKFASGSFPAEINGGRLIDFKIDNGALTVLTDTNIELFNSKGNKMCSLQHSLTTPAVKTSTARSILYGISDTSYKIMNFKGEIYSSKMPNEILTADIAKNGTYAIATMSDSFASEVQVFSKNNKSLFTWSSASELISNVAVASNGKKIAVSTVSANSGELKNKVYIFDYKHATPRYTFEYNQSVLSLKTSSSAGFTVTTENELDYISWSGKRAQNTVDLPVSILKSSYNDYTVVCARRESNKQESDVIIFNNRGKLINRFTVDSNVQDLYFYNKHIYCLVQNQILVYNFSGELTNSGDCGFGVSGVCPISASKTILITDSKLKLCELN